MSDPFLFDLINPEPDPLRHVPRDHASLDGLADETIDAITADVTPEHVDAFVRALSETPRFADDVRRHLSQYPWFPVLSRADTQLRFMRRLRDAAIERGYPVCSANDGLYLGSAEDVQRAANRALALARGATKRALALQAIADRMARS